MRASTKAIALALALGATAPAFAQDEPESDFSISANAAIVSDYRFRGVSLSDGNFAGQGGIDLGHSSGFYIGTWFSSLASVDDTAPFDDGTGTVVAAPIGNYGAVEVDVYAGWSGDVAPGVSFDIGLLYYMYPDALNTAATSAGVGVGGLPILTGTTSFDTDYWEPYASIGFAAGPAEISVGVAYAWDQDSLGGSDNLYVYTDVGVGIPDTPVSISGHLGYTDGVLAPPALAGTADDTGFDYSLGVDFGITDNLSVGVMYTGVEGPSINDFTDDAIVFTLGASF